MKGRSMKSYSSQAFVPYLDSTVLSIHAIEIVRHSTSKADETRLTIALSMASEQEEFVGDLRRTFPIQVFDVAEKLGPSVVRGVFQTKSWWYL